MEGPRVPDPNAAPPDLEGKRAHQAIERYHLGEIEKPKEESTREAGGANSGEWNEYGTRLSEDPNFHVIARFSTRK